MIEVSSAGHTFRGRRGTVEALADVTLSVARGEFVTLIGRSGCGKSTLLSMIAGLLAPTAGSISLDGVPVVEPRRDVAMVFQQPALLPWRTVEANVMLPAEISGVSSLQSRAAELLDTMGLLAFRKRLYEMVRNRSGHVEERLTVGDRVVVLARLEPGQTGRVEYRGSSWQARNDGNSPIEAGREAVISQVDGLTLHVAAE